MNYIYYKVLQLVYVCPKTWLTALLDDGQIRTYVTGFTKTDLNGTKQVLSNAQFSVPYSPVPDGSRLRLAPYLEHTSSFQYTLLLVEVAGF